MTTIPLCKVSASEVTVTFLPECQFFRSRKIPGGGKSIYLVFFFVGITSSAGLHIKERDTMIASIMHLYVSLNPFFETDFSVLITLDLTHYALSLVIIMLTTYK